MEVYGIAYKLFVAIELGIFITAGTLPIIVLVVFFSRTYIFSILLCVFYSVASLTVETMFGVLPKWLCWLLPIPLTTLWGAGDMEKHGFPLNITALKTIIPSTIQTVVILGIMTVISISLISFLYKKRGNNDVPNCQNGNMEAQEIPYHLGRYSVNASFCRNYSF